MEQPTNTPDIVDVIRAAASRSSTAKAGCASSCAWAPDDVASVTVLHWNGEAYASMDAGAERWPASIAVHDSDDEASVSLESVGHRVDELLAASWTVIGTAQ